MKQASLPASTSCITGSMALWPSLNFWFVSLVTKSKTATGQVTHAWRQNSCWCENHSVIREMRYFPQISAGCDLYADSLWTSCLFQNDAVDQLSFVSSTSPDMRITAGVTHVFQLEDFFSQFVFLFWSHHKHFATFRRSGLKKQLSQGSACYNSVSERTSFVAYSLVFSWSWLSVMNWFQILAPAWTQHGRRL